MLHIDKCFFCSSKVMVNKFEYQTDYDCINNCSRVSYFKDNLVYYAFNYVINDSIYRVIGHANDDEFSIFRIDNSYLNSKDKTNIFTGKYLLIKDAIPNLKRIVSLEAFL